MQQQLMCILVLCYLLFLLHAALLNLPHWSVAELKTTAMSAVNFVTVVQNLLNLGISQQPYI
jgi:hypothetical protein